MSCCVKWYFQMGGGGVVSYNLNLNHFIEFGNMLSLIQILE